MNKKVIIGVLTILLLGWIGLSSYWFNTKVNCNSNHGEYLENGQLLNLDEKNLTRPMFKVSDGESFSISNPYTISFYKGKSGINVPDTLTSEFAKLAVFLMNNEEKILNIEGLFCKKEPSDNQIGQERANSLKEYLVYNHGLDAEKIITTAQKSNTLYFEENQTIGPIILSIYTTTATNDTNINEISGTEITEELEDNADTLKEVSISNSTTIDPGILRKVKRKYEEIQ